MNSQWGIISAVTIFGKNSKAFYIFLCFCASFQTGLLGQLLTSAVTKTPHCVSHLQTVRSEMPGKGGSSSVGTMNYFALRSKRKMCRDVKHADIVDITGLWLKPGYTHCGPDQCWNRCWQDNWWKSFFLLSLQQTDAGPISTQSHMKPIRNSCIRLQMRYCAHEILLLSETTLYLYGEGLKLNSCDVVFAVCCPNGSIWCKII